MSIILTININMLIINSNYKYINNKYKSNRFVSKYKN